MHMVSSCGELAVEYISKGRWWQGLNDVQFSNEKGPDQRRHPCEFPSMEGQPVNPSNDMFKTDAVWMYA